MHKATVFSTFQGDFMRDWQNVGIKLCVLFPQAIIKVVCVFFITVSNICSGWFSRLLQLRRTSACLRATAQARCMY